MAALSEQDKQEILDFFGVCTSVEKSFREVVNDRLKANVDTDDMTKPQPCTKFRNVSTVEWMAKLSEETNEVLQEAAILEENADEDGTVDHDNYGLVDVKKRLIMELTDVITLCTSWLDALGCDEEERGEVQRRVNKKNKERGYF